VAEALFWSGMPSHERRMSLPDGPACQDILMELIAGDYASYDFNDNASAK
jgi:hypothetical protein